MAKKSTVTVNVNAESAFLLHQLLIQGEQNAMALERITTEVQEATTVMQSAVTLIGNLATEIREHRDDPAALDALVSELDQNANALANAVAAGTTAADEPALPTGDDSLVDEDPTV